MTDNIKQRAAVLVAEWRELSAKFAKLHGRQLGFEVDFSHQARADAYELCAEALEDALREQHSAHGADEPVATVSVWLHKNGGWEWMFPIIKRQLPPGQYDLYTRPQPASGAIAPIDRDEAYERDYIPLPGGWEVQTKGNGSTFRLCDTKTGDRLAMGVGGGKHEHDMLERMAREIHAAVSTSDADKRDAERYRRLRDCNSEQEDAVLVRGEKGRHTDELVSGVSLDAAIAAQRKGGE